MWIVIGVVRVSVVGVNSLKILDLSWLVQFIIEGLIYYFMILGAVRGHFSKTSQWFCFVNSCVMQKQK